MHAYLKVGFVCLLVIFLTACSESKVKEAVVPVMNVKELPPIHQDYSSNWWKDQPNGNADDNVNWDGEGWVLTANEVSNGIAIADIKTGKPIKYIQGAGTPHHIHMNKDQTWAFATQRYGDSVLAINMDTLDYHNITFPGMGEIPGPQHLTFSRDGKYAYVSLNGAKAVAQIDAEKAQLVKIFKDVGVKPRDMNVTPDGKKLYVSLQASPFITVIDIETGKMKKLERTKTDYGKGTGSGLDMSNDGKYVVVSNTPDNEVAIYDTETDQLIKKIGNIPKPVNNFFMGNTHYLGTGNRSDGSLSIIDVDKMKLLKTVKTGGGTNIGYVGPDGKWYTSQNGSGYLTVIDPKDNFKIERKIWGVQNIHWIQWSPDGSELFASNWGDKTVTKLDLTKEKFFRETIPVGLNPNGIALKTNVPKEKLEQFRNQNDKAVKDIEMASTLVFPEARNENEKAFLGTCLQCHDIGRIIRNNNKGDQWIGLVDRMQGNGAKMTEDSKQKIIEYLKSGQHKTLDIKTEYQVQHSE